MSIISELVEDIVREHYAYLTDCERSITEKARSIAVLNAKAKQIQAETELNKNYFNYQMQERERLFLSASKVLDKAMEQGDSEYAQIAARIIEVIHGKSPFTF